MEPVSTAIIATSAVLNVANIFGSNSSKKSWVKWGNKMNQFYKEIYELQTATYDKQLANLRDNAEFSKEMLGWNFKNIDEAYANNYVRLNNAYADERAKVYKNLRLASDKMVSGFKMQNTSYNSYLDDARNYLAEEADSSIRELNSTLQQESEEFSKERTQQSINANSNYMQVFMNNSNSMLAVGANIAQSASNYYSNTQSVNNTVASAKAQANSDMWGSMMNLTNIFGDTYNSYKNGEFK